MVRVFQNDCSYYFETQLRVNVCGTITTFSNDCDCSNKYS